MAAIDPKSLLAQADAQYALAEKSLKPGWMPWAKPDWDTAAFNYEKAANSYKAGKATARAVDCYRKAADAKYRLGMVFVAGKQLETGAMLAKTTNATLSAQMFREAALMYSEDGKSDKAASALAAGAKALETVDVTEAIDLYQRALDAFEIDDKETMGMDTFRALLALTTREKRWDDARACIDKQSAACAKHNRTPEQYKLALSLVVINLARDDYVAADKAYQASMSIPGFPPCDESKCAARLIDAFEDHDPAALAKALQDRSLDYLHVNVQKLAKALRVPGDGIPSKKSREPSAASASTAAAAAVPVSYPAAAAAPLPSAAAAAAAPALQSDSPKDTAPLLAAEPTHFAEPEPEPESQPEPVFAAASEPAEDDTQGSLC